MRGSNVGKANIALFGGLAALAAVSIMHGAGQNLESDFAAANESQRASASIAGEIAPASPVAAVEPQPASQPMSEEQRLDLANVDPQMKQASDFMSALINANGHLCASISNVVPRDDGTYRVTCVVHNDGRDRATYRVNGETSEATPI